MIVSFVDFLPKELGILFVEMLEYIYIYALWYDLFNEKQVYIFNDL